MLVLNVLAASLSWILVLERDGHVRLGCEEDDGDDVRIDFNVAWSQKRLPGHVSMKTVYIVSK